MRAETKTAALKRLARLEGQVRGIARMVEDDRYCIDVVRQVQAVKAALSAFEGLVIEDHIATCVDTALQSDELDDRRDKVKFHRTSMA